MQGAIMHSYPFCWRSDTPLIYKAVPSWFVRVEEIKPQVRWALFWGRRCAAVGQRVGA